MKVAFYLPGAASAGDAPRRVSWPGLIPELTGREGAHGRESVGIPARGSRLAGLFMGSQCLGETKAPVSVCWQAGRCCWQSSCARLGKGTGGQKCQVGEGRLPWLCIFRLPHAGTLAVLSARSPAVVSGGEAPPSLAAGSVGTSGGALPSWQRSCRGAHQPWCGGWHRALPCASLLGLPSLTCLCRGVPGAVGRLRASGRAWQPQAVASPSQKHLSF